MKVSAELLKLIIGLCVAIWELDGGKELMLEQKSVKMEGAYSYCNLICHALLITLEAFPFLTERKEEQMEDKREVGGMGGEDKGNCGQDIKSSN